MGEDSRAAIQKYSAALGDLRRDHQRGRIDWLPPVTKTPRVYAEGDYAGLKVNPEPYVNHGVLLVAAAQENEAEVLRWLATNFSVDEGALKLAFFEASRVGNLEVLELLKRRFADFPFELWPAFVRAMTNDRAEAAMWLADFVSPTGPELARLLGALARKGNEDAIGWLTKRFPPP